MMSFTGPQTLAPIALVLLAACGGSGDGAPTTQDVILPLIDPAATGSVTLAGVSLDSVARATSGLTVLSTTQQIPSALEVSSET